MRDQRQHARREVSIETRLFLPSVNPKIIGCRLLDISEGGARIEVDVKYKLPSEVFILRAEYENMYECQTAWQEGRTAGLKFLHVCTREQQLTVMEAMKTAQIVDKDHPSLS